MRIILAHEAKIKNGSSTLGELAISESDCSSARKMGDLGYFGKGDMQKEFEDAAFQLKPGEVSGVVETASGLHLIERCVLSLLDDDRKLLMRYVDLHSWIHGTQGTNTLWHLYEPFEHKHISFRIFS